MCGCASTSEAKKACPKNGDSTTTYTGNKDECACEAQAVIDYYKSQINMRGIIDINYSQDNAMHAQSCQKAILAKDHGFTINMVSESGMYVYGYHYPMSNFVW